MLVDVTLPKVGDLVFQKLAHAIFHLQEPVPLVTKNCSNTIRPARNKLINTVSK